MKEWDEGLLVDLIKLEDVSIIRIIPSSLPQNAGDNTPDSADLSW